MHKQSSCLASEYQGTTYEFCGEGCKESFENDPE